MIFAAIINRSRTNNVCHNSKSFANLWHIFSQLVIEPIAKSAARNSPVHIHIVIII